MHIHFYKINTDYIKFLHYNYDNRVQYNAEKDNRYNGNRPYIGIVLTVNEMKYFAPLEHPRPEHKKIKSNPHIVKIENGKYGLIGLNNMIPVPHSQLLDFDINEDKNRKLLLAQYIYCDNNSNLIYEKAQNLYKRRTGHPNKFEESIYCDFKKLEQGMMDYCRLHNLKCEYDKSSSEEYIEAINEQELSQKEVASGKITES